MLTRMVDPSLRVTPDWELGESSWSAQGATLGDLVPLGSYIPDPASAEELDESIRYMLSNNTNVLELCYDNITVSAAQDVMEAALAGVKTYCEQCYNTVNCTYSTNGTLTLTFSAADAGDRILTYRDAAMDAAIAVHDQLWESGALNASMSDYEKARVYFAWICDNCVYDYGAGDHSLSHIAYSLFENGTAVCDGYTGAYNMLLKLEGIDCTALSNSSHIWTVATLDGTEYHIDTTWGDSGPTPNYDYFAMTPEVSGSTTAGDPNMRGASGTMPEAPLFFDLFSVYRWWSRRSRLACSHSSSLTSGPPPPAPPGPAGPSPPPPR